MQIPALPDLCFHLVSTLKPAVQGLMWHFCQHTAILQASQQCKNTFCGSSSCWRHTLQAIQSQYALNAPKSSCLLCLPHSQEVIKITCTACGVQGQCWWRPLGEVQISFLNTHSHTAQIQSPARPHTLPCTRHVQNTPIQPSAPSCRCLPSPEWMWQHRYLTLWKCNSSGSEEAKDQILFGSKALS